LGFEHSSFGQVYDFLYFEEEIRRIHREDPEARFVLVGFSLGANVIMDMTQSLLADDITIDLLVYLAGDTLRNTPECRPENARRILHITSASGVWLPGGLFDGAGLDGADNVWLEDVGHFDVPTHPRTLAALACGLAEVAAAPGANVRAARAAGRDRP
jgi:hypothetical protein